MGRGERKEACMKRKKKFGRHFETHEKDSGHFSAVSHRGSFVATARYTLMLTQTDQKERPSAVYSTVVSISHERGQREQSLCWAFSVCQHASGQ